MPGRKGYRTEPLTSRKRKAYQNLKGVNAVEWGLVMGVGRDKAGNRQSGKGKTGRSYHWGWAILAVASATP